MGFSLMGNGKFGSGVLGMGLFGSDSEDPSLPPPPDYFEDPNYRTTQDFLQKYGIDLMGGTVPDYYKGIGEAGGSDFENMLALSNRDINQSAMEAAARTGRGRGGALPSVTAQAIADNEKKLRYADYERALTGKANLLRLGTDITTGVRNSGQTEGLNRNNFNLKQYDYIRQNALWDINRADQEAAAQGDLIGKLFQGGVGAAVGFATGGPAGAVMGGVQGLTGSDISSLFGGGSSTKQAAGVSDIGSIDLGTDIEKYFL